MGKVNFTFAKMVIQEQESIIRDIRDGKNLKEYFIENNITILICTLIYGAVLGCYVGGSQILLNSVKIPLLFFITLYISLPIFYILELILGGKIEIEQLAVMLLTGYVVAAIIMLAFTPFMLFFILTAKEYYFTVFLTIGIMGLSGYFSLFYIYKSYLLFHIMGIEVSEDEGISKEQIIEGEKNWLPSFIVGSFSIAFVGTQLSWALRPYFHSHDSFTRPQDGNFYVAIAEAVGSEPWVATSLLCSFGFIAFLVTAIMYQRSTSRPTPPPPYNVNIPLQRYQYPVAIPYQEPQRSERVEGTEKKEKVGKEGETDQ